MCRVLCVRVYACCLCVRDRDERTAAGIAAFAWDSEALKRDIDYLYFCHHVCLIEE